MRKLRIFPQKPKTYFAILNYSKALLTTTCSSYRAGANVTGYFVWSFEDNFEWNDGYTRKFGLYCINYEKDLERKAKASAIWFRNFLQMRPRYDILQPSLLQSAE